MVSNVYIHIPFCNTKCKYCSFVSITNQDLKDTYLKALAKEIQSNYMNEPLKTLYFGGGTPSILKPNDFDNLIKLFNINDKTEITAELNPETITQKYLAQIKKAKINRISFGCQTFNNNILKNIGRKHNAKDVINAVNYAQNENFQNISLDFIYGLPNQDLKEFENDLQTAIKLNIQHISLYGLKIEKGCYFFKNPPDNIPDNDTQAEMYVKAIEILTNNGFQQYEISNFAKQNYQSRHNLNYWNNHTYYGFGAAAHGYQNKIRYSNTTKVQEYINNPTIHKYSHKVTLQEELEEEIFLGFRKSEGINIDKINKKFNIDFCEKYRKIIQKYTSYKYLSETKTGFTLSTEGFLISNTILAEFLE